MSAGQPASRTCATQCRGRAAPRGSEVAALASALVLTAAAAETAFVGRLGLFFDLCFVLVCLGRR